MKHSKKVSISFKQLSKLVKEAVEETRLKERRDKASDELRVKSWRWNDDTQCGRVTFNLGKIADEHYYSSGRRSCMVDLDVQITDRNEKPQFSVMAGVWNANGTDYNRGGQMADDLADHNGDYYSKLPRESQKLIDAVYPLWSEYHLKFMDFIPEEDQEKIIHIVRDRFDVSRDSHGVEFTEGREVDASKSRAFTEALIEDAEEGIISWESIARAALGYMSEDEVQDMAESEFDYEEASDEEEEEEEEEDLDYLDTVDEEIVQEEYRKFSQRELRQMCRSGHAQDITNIGFDEAKKLRERGYDVEGVSMGVYGLNGALIRMRDTGDFMAVCQRNTILAYLV